MLIRICLIVAILAALAAGGLNFVKVKEKINAVVTERNTDRDAKTAAETQTAKAKKDLDKATQELKKSQADLVSAKDERAKAVADADVQRKQVSVVRDSTIKVTQERDELKGELARFLALNRTPEQILAFDKDIRQAQLALEEEKVVIKSWEQKAARLQTRLDIYEHPDNFVSAPANLKGKILVMDPKWDFVVLDIGEDQGVPENCEFLVSRNGQLVAKVVVRTVQKGSSIANLVPGWKLGEVVEGDQVIPAHPAS